MKRISSQTKKEKYIKRFSLEEKISREALDAMQLWVFEEGEYIYHQDDAADNFYLLLDGELQVHYLHANGKLSILTIAKPIFTVGELELFENFPKVRNVLVLRKSALFSVGMEKMRQLGFNDPKFLRFIINQLVGKLCFSSQRVAQTILPLENQLAEFLMGRLKAEGSVISLANRNTLASSLGCSVRHLNRTLETFSHGNILKIDHRSLKILDPEKLAELALEPFPRGT